MNSWSASVVSHFLELLSLIITYIVINVFICLGRFYRPNNSLPRWQVWRHNNCLLDNIDECRILLLADGRTTRIRKCVVLYTHHAHCHTPRHIYKHKTRTRSAHNVKNGYIYIYIYSTLLYLMLWELSVSLRKAYCMPAIDRPYNTGDPYKEDTTSTIIHRRFCVVLYVGKCCAQQYKTWNVETKTVNKQRRRSAAVQFPLFYVEGCLVCCYVICGAVPPLSLWVFGLPENGSTYTSQFDSHSEMT